MLKVYGVSLVCILATLSGFAQHASNDFSLDSLAQVQRARRFPFCGKLSLDQNYPDPVTTSEETTIGYRAIDAIYASIIVYSSQGQQVVTRSVGSGVGRITLNGSELKSGTYFYALFVNGRRISKRKLVVIDKIHVARSTSGDQ
jgi:Secretion system C-terminal sorting domain